MICNSLRQQFREIWLVDFEFYAPSGEIPVPLCMVAQEFFSGQSIRYWQDQLLSLKAPPFDISHNSLFAAYYASAEIGCFLSLGWPIPANILDLYEFRCLTNGLTVTGGRGLTGALQFYGLPSISAHEKESMQNLGMRGGDYTDSEKNMLLDYCQSDVTSLYKLLPAMIKDIDLPYSMIRGRYMATVAQIERNGVPIDPIFNKLKFNWKEIQKKLVARIDESYGIFEGITFKQEKFKSYLNRENIAWPLLPTGRLDLRDDTFKYMARIYPKLEPIRELRASLSQMRLADLSVGKDIRNRCVLSPFSSKTGRNQPSSTAFIFGPAVWLRSLIKPTEGYGIAYIDWSQQEFGIAAALSGDELMMQAYTSGDPYLEFAKQAKAVPEHATKQSHEKEREQFKACVLAVQYGMGAESLAIRIGDSVAMARHLLELHHHTYSKFWQWSDSVLDYAMQNSELHTVFNWKLHIGNNPNPRSLRNFPMQANGAEMLRLACIYGIKAGIKICAPVHDAVLIEAPIRLLDNHVETMQSLMAKASRDVLNGFELRSDVKLFPYPERYMDKRGEQMWNTIQMLLEETG